MSIGFLLIGVILFLGFIGLIIYLCVNGSKNNVCSECGTSLKGNKLDHCPKCGNPIK